jgi:hypothetical protein
MGYRSWLDCGREPIEAGQDQENDSNRHLWQSILVMRLLHQAAGDFFWTFFKKAGRYFVHFSSQTSLHCKPY